MTRADFPTITPDVCRRYIRIGRTTPGVMFRRCAWCNDSMGTKECAPEMHGTITHGICDHCAKTILGEDAHLVDKKATDLAGGPRNNAGAKSLPVAP